MPANTPRGFPYPLPAEPVAEGAQAIRNLAEAIDAAELAYAQITAAATITASGTDATAASLITLPSALYPAAAVRLEAFLPALQSSVAGTVILLLVWDNTANAQVGRISSFKLPTANDFYGPFNITCRITPPSAGARIYSLRGFAGGAGNHWLQCGAGGAATYLPASLRTVRV